MKVPSQWLQDYLDKPVSAERMAEALERGGIEVEQIMYAHKLDAKIIAARVKKVARHPQADRLKLATVDTGSAEIEVVCGAPNLKTGQIVVLAQVDTKLPDETKISSTVIRGQTSNGMLCSPKELGISDDHAGILVLADDTKLGQPVSSLISNSDVIDVTTQANRFDLLSLVGLAREISAQTGVGLKLPPDSQLDFKDEPPEVVIEAQDLVNRYLLVGMKVDQSHGTNDAGRQRLEAAGLRSLGLVVDITNYTMLEWGQPLHAFDGAKVHQPVTVRLAKSGELIKTLDGQQRKLTDKDLVIADTKGPIALAGVMGGQRTEVSPDTKEILIESASFDAATVRKMAQRHGLRSDASSRFERSLPPYLAEVGLQRAIYSFEMAAGGKVTTRVADLGPATGRQTKISVLPEHVSKVLSLEVSVADLAEQLPKLGFEVAQQALAATVTVPWWRPDVVLAEDLAEEYIRLVGFDQVQARLPVWKATSLPADNYWPRLWQTKAALKGLGLFEIITYSFVSAQQLQQLGYKLSDHLKLKNPMSTEQAYLRRNLLASLLTTTVHNQLYAPEFGIYEISHTFEPTKAGELPAEPTQLAVLVKTKANGYAGAKAALDTLAASFRTDIKVQPSSQPEFLPSRSALVKAGSKTIGRIGQLHPKLLADFKGQVSLGYLELDLAALWDAQRPVQYESISRFPSLYRDLAIVVPIKVQWQEVATVISETELARPTFLSDYYDSSLGTGNKSLALRLEMSSLEGTLTDKESSQRLEKITALLSKRFGASLRS